MSHNQTIAAECGTLYPHFRGDDNCGMENKTVNLLLSLPRKPILWLIHIYQKTLSPDHGWQRVLYPHGYCRFYPTCSEYGYQSIKKHGLIRGIPMAIWRVL